VATKATLPLSGNAVGDQRVVFDDGDGKQAVYACIATTGTVDQQWAKIADVDWMSEEQTRILQEQERVLAESARDDAEGLRVIAEGSRVDAEDIRVTNEGTRQSQESTRQSQESTRQSQEGTRVSQELARVGAEEDRVLAEDARNVWEAYDNAKAYVVGNKVAYLGSSYRCILASTGNLPTNTTYWLLIAQKGDNTTADNVTNTPSGNISSTTVQGALNELDAEKASKAQEAWITPTLTGGASNHTTYITRYYKNQIGEVVLDGRVKDFSLGSSFFILPIGYRPSQLVSFAVNSNNALGIVNISTDGQVIVAVGNITTLFLSGIRFKAV